MTDSPSTGSDAPLHRCITKATRAQGDQLKRGPNWITARRALLQIHPDRLECKDWIIPYDAIEETVLYSIRSAFFIPAFVLKVTTADETYHFGLNPGKFWKGDLPFPIQREKARLGYSAFSLVIRLILIAYLGYWAWQRFRGGG